MSKVDVVALLEGSDLRMDGVPRADLERFASLVLDEAAKVCDHRIATNPGDDVRNFEAQMIAEWIREMKPGQP